MKRQNYVKMNTGIAVVIIALVLLAVVGIVLGAFGFRYIKADNGSKFIGKLNGDGVVVKGTVFLPDGTKGKLDRTLGTIVYSTGDVYEGEFSGFYRHGEGKMTYAESGNTYVGSFVEDKISGVGVYESFDGSRYEGEFSDGKKSGNGKFTWSDGTYYEGGFLDNMKHGTGKHVWADGSSYEGEYASDKKNGNGTFVYANGDKYVGEFVDDKREGVGTYVYANGEIYEGEFKNNTKNGNGKYTWPSPNSRFYEGSFKDGAIVIEDENTPSVSSESK